MGTAAVKRSVQRFLDKRGVHVSAYRFTYQARRQRIWRQHEVTHVLDIGANSGQYAGEIRGHGYTGWIHSFEPTRQAFEALSAAARGTPAWSIHQIALGASTGKLLIHVSEASTFSSALPVAPVTTESFPSAAYVSEESAELRRLDDLLPALVPADSAYAVKMDVQGFERDVILGGREALAHAQVVEVEMCPVELYLGQWTLLDVMSDMYAHGFVPALVENIFYQNDGRSLAFNGLFVHASRL